jgi:hypothetical protein
LLDALWEVRREVYRQYAFKEHSWEELFLMEYEIERRLVEDDSIEEAECTGRSEIIQVYTTAAKQITNAVIEEEMSKMVSNRTSAQACMGEAASVARRFSTRV